LGAKDLGKLGKDRIKIGWIFDRIFDRIKKDWLFPTPVFQIFVKFFLYTTPQVNFMKK
jgi:hypothetical protein